MDLWSDPNRTPYMAVTSHWIQGIYKETIEGTKLTLKLRSDLIGFQRVPGRHDGKHLATAFVYITDRIGITDKVLYFLNRRFGLSLTHCQIGWITLDNASNNDTFFVHLERLLRQRNIKFDIVGQHIRYTSRIFHSHSSLIKSWLPRCFPHIVNLACKAVLGAITELKYAKDDAVDFAPDPDTPAPATFEEVLKRDPVATTRSLIRGVSVHLL